MKQDLIRVYSPADEDAIAELWHRTGLAAYPYLPTWQALTLDEARRVIHRSIEHGCQIWVGVLDGEIVAFMQMIGAEIDRLFVTPGQWRCGWGTRLINLAKQVSPDELELFTHQENVAARTFYKKHGFKAVKFGISPPPESAPDVKYVWKP